MSLINQMLKDLEGRTKLTTNQSTILTGLQPSVPSVVSRNYKHKIIYMVILASLSIMFIAIWKITHKPLMTPSNITIQHSEKNVLPDNDVQTSTTNNQPTILTGITLQVDSNNTFVRLLMNKNLLYRVYSVPAENILTIKLENAELTANLPQLDYLNSGINDIQINKEADGELTINLKLNPDTELKHIELNETDKFPELQIDFTKVANEQPKPNKEIVDLEQTNMSKRLNADLNVDQQYQQALQYFSLGQNKKAIQVLDEGMKELPFYEPFIELKSRILVKEGKVERALNLLLKAPPSIETKPDYYAFIAALYQRLGKFSAASQVYERLIILQPDKGEWWLGLGIALEGVGKKIQAQEAYARANECQDLNPELRAYIGTRLRL